MPRIKYQSINISGPRLEIIKTANDIIAQYAAQGFELTLRQLYYQFVARDLIANSQQEYKKLGDIVNDGRLAGLIDWEAIVDRTRNLRSVNHWEDPSNIIDACARQFRIDKWAGQSFRPEVWIEKDALVGVIEGICTELDVPYFSCRGYTSQSEMWAAGRRLRNYVRGVGGRRQTPIILHFGDHDPSGMDMTRDITDRLALFMEGEIEVRRLALNSDQIARYNPPPNPAKVTDSRAAAYIEQFGTESWELDALEPAVLVALVQSAVEALRAPGPWAEAVEEEERHRTLLGQASERWGDVVSLLEENTGDEE